MPSYLDFTMQSLSREQDSLRAQMTRTFGSTALEAIEEQTRRNMVLFERSMRMFSPFVPAATGDAAEAETGKKADDAPAAAAAGDDIGDLKQELAEMQAKLDRLARR